MKLRKFKCLNLIYFLYLRVFIFKEVKIVLKMIIRLFSFFEEVGLLINYFKDFFLILR